MNKNNSFSIIVPALNEELYIERCLKCLIAQNYRGEYEIIVVDNGSTDKTKSIAEKYGVRVFSEPQRGIAKALIKGCKYANGNILVFTDADTLVPKNWLTRYNAIFNSDEKILAAGGFYEFYDQRFLARVIFNKILKPILSIFLQGVIYRFLVILPGANMAVRKTAYKKIGGFNSEIEWGQELDLVRRMSNLGKIKIDKNLIVRTSFRRYDGEQNKSWLGAFFSSMKELTISAYRLHAMLIINKNFSAQNEIRKME